MSTFAIKMIAVITMVIDHIGLYFFPQHPEFRIIGRLSFPLFAWLIANGAYYTRDIKQYISRLFIFAIVSQIPYFLAVRTVHSGFVPLNILFTLSAGLLCIFVWQREAPSLVKIPVISLIALLSGFLGFEYGAYGVATIVSFYLFFGEFKKLLISQAILLPIYATGPAGLSYFLYGEFNLHNSQIYQFAAITALFFVRFYNERPGIRAKYLFYIFYPGHLAVIYLIKVLTGY